MWLQLSIYGYFKTSVNSFFISRCAHTIMVKTSFFSALLRGAYWENGEYPRNSAHSSSDVLDNEKNNNTKTNKNSNNNNTKTSNNNKFSKNNKIYRITTTMAPEKNYAFTFFSRFCVIIGWTHHSSERSKANIKKRKGETVTARQCKHLNLILVAGRLANIAQLQTCR